MGLTLVLRGVLGRLAPEGVVMNLPMSAKTPFRWILVALAVTIGWSANVRAQTVDVLRGRVTGPERQPLEGVEVTVTTLSGAVSRTARSDRNGRYMVTFPDGDGDYFASFRSLGYAPPGGSHGPTQHVVCRSLRQRGGRGAKECRRERRHAKDALHLAVLHRPFSTRLMCRGAPHHNSLNPKSRQRYQASTRADLDCWRAV